MDLVEAVDGAAVAGGVVTGPRWRSWGKLAQLFGGGGALVLIWIALTAINLVPVWHQRLLPMLDTPNHLALVRGWHSFNDPAYHITDYYTKRLKFVPYIFFYSAIHALMFFVKIETANKLFLSLYLILFPLSVLSVARALGRSPWLALGAFPLSYNPAWIYGYSSLLIGNCFALFSLAALIAYLRTKRERNLLLLLLCSTLAYSSHIMPWFLFGLAAICFLILHRRDWRYGVRAAGAMVPSVLFALVAMLEEKYDHAYVHEGAKFAYEWRDAPTLFLELPRRILEIFPGSLDMIVLAVITATTVGLCFWRGVREEGAGEHRHLKIVLTMLAILYLLLPYQITGPLIFFQMAQRIPAIFAALALLLPVGRFVGKQRLVFVPLLIACAALPLKMARLYRDFSNRNAGFMHLIAEVPLGAKTFVVPRGMMKVDGSVAEVSGDPATSAPVYWHFSSWPMALRGGYSPFLFDQGIPIRYKGNRLKSPHWAACDSFDIRQAPEFDYYLIKNPTDVQQREPSLRLVDQIGEWWLFQRMYPLTDEP